MKYRIEDLKDITDSREVMESRPKGFSKYMTYIILGLLIIIIIWSIIAKKEVSIRAAGVIRPTEDISKVSSGIAGNITNINIKDGDKVKKDDILVVINGSEYILQKNLLQENLDKKVEELEGLIKLKESVLDGDSKFDLNNKVQSEYYKKYKIYLDNLNLGDSQEIINEKQRAEIDNNIVNLELLKKAVEEEKNYFDEKSLYYYQYKDYEIAMNNFRSVIKTYNEKIRTLELSITETNKENIQQEINLIKGSIGNSNKEMEKHKNTTILNIVSQIAENKSKLNQLASTDTSNYKEQYLSGLDSNISSLESSIDDIKMNLELANEKINATSIKAPCDGVINLIQEVKVGDFIQGGFEVASIIPEDTSNFNVEVYIENQNFGEIKDGQDVVIELVSLPGSEYGYIKSNLNNISVDAKVTQEEGRSFYKANCPISETFLKNNKEEIIQIKNGMAAEVRIINREVSYFRYFLEKIEILN